MATLHIENFAHIREVDIRFGDLTVLVGAQATGKSLALQWLATPKSRPSSQSASMQSGNSVPTCVAEDK